jgi:SAM-dependent methyltransferase
VYRDPLPARDTTPAAELTPGAAAVEERVAARRAVEFARVIGAAGRPGRLLDVGTGLGYFLRAAGAAGWSAVGIDADAAVVGYARARLGVDARAGDLAAQRFPDGAFDLVTLWNVLDVVDAPRAVLAEARRVLAPGGRVFVRVPNVAWQLVAFRTTAAARALGLFRRIDDIPYAAFIFNATSFSSRTLAAVLRDAGFDQVRVRNSRPIPGDPYLHLSGAGERALGAAKRLVHAGAAVVAGGSRGRWLLGSSIEAWARRR